MSPPPQPKPPCLENSLAPFLLSHSFRRGNERDLQDGIEKILHSGGYSFEREYALDDTRHSVVDFFFPADKVALEVKLNPSTGAVLRQLHRYAGFPQVDRLILVCLRPLNLPQSLHGKPLTGIFLWRQMM